MSQSLSQVYLHIIFSTKNFEPIIPKRIQLETQAFIVKTISNKGIYTEEIFVNPDHVHILCTLPRTMTIAQLVSFIKAPSSKILKEKGIRSFHWQNGYACFSVSASKLEAVKNYIQKQEVHHRQSTFQEELRIFLKEYNVKYDERYIWD